MTFFYDLNKKLAGISDKQEAKQINESAVAEAGYSAKAARAGKDIGKPGKAFAQIAKSAGERYGSKERGEKVAGAVLAKLRAKEDVEEGFVDTVKQGAQSALQAIGQTLGHGSDEDMIKDLQKKAGVPVTGKVQPQPGQQPQGQKPTPMAEDDMEEGNKFTGNLMKARAAGVKKADLDGDGDMETVREGSKPDFLDVDKDGNKKESFKKAVADKKKGNKEEELDEGWDDMMKSVKARRDSKVGDVEHGAKHDIEHTATGRKVTRRVDDKGISVGADDDKPADGEKRGRGRPKKDKAPERVTGKAYKHKGGRKSVEEGVDGQAQQIYNDLADIRAIAKQAQGGGAFPQGFASRLESALWAAMTLIKNQQPANAQVREEELDEKAVSQQQQKFMGMVHAMQKGEKVKGASKELKKVAREMPKKAAKDFAATKHAGLPKKVKKQEEVEETTVSGSVATATEAPKKSKGGSVVGKGIYDSLNRKLEDMIAESMNVSVNMSTDEHGEPHKNITISAEGEAAEQLAQLLNLAGMPAQEHNHDDVCPTCGEADCGCDEMVDENAPDWPTNPETTGGDDPQMDRWAGGLNKPKETGQTTIPVVNRDPARGSVGPVGMAEDKDLGMKLYAELKGFKG